MATDLLAANEAALLLGITPELLYSYAVKGVRVGIGSGCRLAYTSRGGRDGFARQDLEAFDAYLREPWADEGDDRPAIPTFVVDYLKIESGGGCARCGKGHKLVNAHIIPYAECRSHHHHNLIRLCTECHEVYDSKALVRIEAILELKTRLVAHVRDRLVRSASTELGGVRRMPNAAPQFVDRDEEVTAVVEALKANRTVSVEGPAGIGKTQLVINALARLGKDRRVIWVDVEAHRTVEDLKVTLRAALPEAGEGVLVRSVEDALAALDVQLVFDGVEQLAPSDMDDLEDFLQGLIRGTQTPRFLLTSQVHLLNLDVDVRIPVGPISAAAARLILKSGLELIESAEEEKPLRWLESFCSGHPFTLQITKELLRYFRSAEIVVGRIQREQAGALENPTRQRQNRQTSLPICLSVSYGILTEPQRRLLWFASQCPAGYFSGFVAGPDRERRHEETEHAAALAHWHLIELDRWGENRTRLHVLSPIRAFVKQQWEFEAPDAVREMELKLTRALTFQAMILDQRYLSGQDVEYGMLRFDMEFPNFVERLIATSRPDVGPELQELSSALASSLMVYCFVRGRNAEGTRILRLGVGAARLQGAFGRASELLIRLISLAARLPDVKLIRTACAEMEEIALITKEPLHEANCASARAALALEEGRLDDAIREGEAAVEAYARCAASVPAETLQDAGNDELSEQNWPAHMRAMASKQLGFAYMRAKRLPEAMARYEEALEWIDRDNDQVNRGSVLHQIGNCAGDLGQMDRALACYLEAASCFEAIGMEEYISNSLSEIGWLLVQWDPPSSPESIVETKQLVLGLEDGARQALRMFPSAQTPLPDGAVPTIRKLLGLEGC